MLLEHLWTFPPPEAGANAIAGAGAGTGALAGAFAGAETGALLGALEGAFAEALLDLVLAVGADAVPLALGTGMEPALVRTDASEEAAGGVLASVAVDASAVASKLRAEPGLAAAASGSESLTA